ncbi:MAG TPA: ParB N-terminal domain-containing protein [Candidatus Kapabacteria bacterium]
MKWTNERRPIDSLTDYPKNPRTAEAKGMANLKQSIESVGYVEPIAINTDGTILSGHRRKETLELLGVREVDVRVPERTLTDAECREVVIRLNRNIAGVWNMESLTSDFEVGELLDWGFTDFELGVRGTPEGIEFDAGLTDGESVMATFRIKLPQSDVETFELRLDDILRDFPHAVKEKKV